MHVTQMPSSSASTSWIPPSHGCWISRSIVQSGPSTSSRSEFASTRRSPNAETPFAPRTPPRGFGSDARAALSGIAIVASTSRRSRSTTRTKPLGSASPARRTSVVTTARTTGSPRGRGAGGRAPGGAAGRFAAAGRDPVSSRASGRAAPCRRPATAPARRGRAPVASRPARSRAARASRPRPTRTRAGRTAGISRGQRSPFQGATSCSIHGSQGAPARPAARSGSPGARPGRTARRGRRRGAATSAPAPRADPRSGPRGRRPGPSGRPSASPASTQRRQSRAAVYVLVGPHGWRARESATSRPSRTTWTTCAVGEQLEQQRKLEHVLRRLVAPARLALAARPLLVRPRRRAPGRSGAPRGRPAAGRAPTAAIGAERSRSEASARARLGGGRIAVGAVQRGQHGRLGRERQPRVRAQQVANERRPAARRADDEDRPLAHADRAGCALGARQYGPASGRVDI